MTWTPRLWRSPLARIVAALSLFGMGSATGFTQSTDRRAIEHFESKVRPVLLDRCVKCHGPEQTKGGLRLDRREGLIQGGDTGAVIVAGQPEASRLVEAIR